MSTPMIRKLIGYCCETEMVEAANAELRGLHDEIKRLREELGLISTTYVVGNDDPYIVVARIRKAADAALTRRESPSEGNEP